MYVHIIVYMYALQMAYPYPTWLSESVWCSVVQCGACKALTCGLVYIYMQCTYIWICTCTAYKWRVRTQHDFLMQDDGVSCIDVRGSVYVESSLLSGAVYYSELHWSAGQCTCICNRPCICICYRPCLPWLSSNMTFWVCASRCWCITATHCNTLQHTATHCNTLQHTATHLPLGSMYHCNTLQHVICICNRPCLPWLSSNMSVLQCVAVCCSVLQCVAVWCVIDVLLMCIHLQSSKGVVVHNLCPQYIYTCMQCVAVCCSVLQCVAVCCSAQPLSSIYINMYDSFHWKYCTPRNPSYQELQYLGISRYKFKLRLWF